MAKRPRHAIGDSTPPEFIREMDVILRGIDDDCIAEGKPILSALVIHDNGVVSNAFWESVQKHGLRRPGEDDATLIMRLRAAAFLYHGKKQRPV